MTFIHLITASIVIGILLPGWAAVADNLQKVRIGYPSSAVSTLPFDITKEKGFYVKAGLDVEYIQMRTVIAWTRLPGSGTIAAKR